MPLTLVWGGVGVHSLGWVLESSFLLAAGMGLSAWGLVLFHRKKGHPTRYGVISAFLVLVPVFGPLAGLVLKPRSPTAKG